jgi:hypothetical protein
MPKSPDLDLVKLVLQRNLPDVRVVAQILADLNEELAALVDEDRGPPEKKQFVIIRLHDEAGLVVKIPENLSPATIEASLLSAASEFNATPKGRRLPIKAVAEACEHIPARFFKERGLTICTKEPVAIVTLPPKF